MLSFRSKITKAVLGYFFLHEHAELYVLEMARKLHLDDGNLTRKLRDLEREGILKSEEKGRERYYSLNKAFPLLKEYRQIVMKTVGLEGTFQRLLDGVRGINQAYLFGSYAKDRMDSSSDIDLMVVGRHDTVELRKKLTRLQKMTDREINLVSMSPSEYEKRKKHDPFVKSIQKSKKVKLV
jgi:predicted nucleotidyltransferase